MTMTQREASQTPPASRIGSRRFSVILGLALGLTFAGVAGAGAAAASTPTASHDGGQKGSSAKWDEIVSGMWVVPSVNLETYEVAKDNAIPGLEAFENWYTFTCTDGHYEGQTQSVLQFKEPDGTWSAPVMGPLSVMSGSISPAGVISMTIVHDNDLPTSYAKGHMIFVAGEWRMTMQVQMPLTASQKKPTPFILQWANMTKTTTIPGAPDFTDLGSMTNTSQSGDPLASPQFTWLARTHWTVHDTAFEGGRTLPFRISRYSNGYFFGASSGTRRFWVSGSVAPDGSVFLVLAQDDGTLFVRSGTLSGRGGNGGAHMRFSSFYGAPAHGSAAQR